MKMILLLIAGIISLLTVYRASAEVVDYGAIKVVHATEFPIYSDELFYLYFSSRLGQFPIFSMLVFIISDGVRVLEKGYFYPGFFYELEYPFLGKFLQLLVATVHTNQSISVRVQFNEIANWRQLEVRYGEFVSRDKMNYAKDNFWLYTAVMYSRTVQLLVRTRLLLHTVTTDGRMDGVVAAEDGYLVCRGTHGYPRQRVRLTPAYRLQVVDEQYDDVLNEHKVKIRFHISDHLSQYDCATTDARASATINVFHHPTKLRLEPSYYSTMPNGSSVQCVADDGFPKPKIMWYFIRGPINSDWYFNVHQYQLFLLPNAPIGSQWSLQCVAENTIPPNSHTNSSSLLFSFVVVHSSYRFIVVMASSATAVVCVLAIVVVLIVIFHPRCIHGRAASQRPMTHNPDTHHRKELAFDPDTAASLRLSQSTDCVHDDVPRYEDIVNGSIDTAIVGAGEAHTTMRDTFDGKLSSRDVGSTCYV